MRVNPDYAVIWGDLPAGEYRALRESIRVDGLFEKITVNPKLEILDGKHRYQALLELGRPVRPGIEYEIRDFGDPTEDKLFIIRTQLNRRHASSYHRIENAFPLLEIERQKARDRRGTRTDLTSVKNLTDVGRTNEMIGRIVGLSYVTVDKALYIIQHGSEKIKEKLRDGKISISHVYTSLKRREKHGAPPPLPEGLFDVIYADPPWKYYFPLRGAPDQYYPTMTDEEICAVKVPSADQAILFLWATNPKLEDALRVITAWGFKYVTNMAWEKDRLATGYYVRGIHELLLIAKKGKMSPPLEEDRPPSLFHAPVKAHSEKPEIIYEIIEKMYPNRSYLELFARPKKQRPGWTYWGLEVG